MDISTDSVLIISESDEDDDNWSPIDASIHVPSPLPPTPCSTSAFIPQLSTHDADGKHHQQPDADVIIYQSSADGEDNDTRLLNR